MNSLRSRLSLAFRLALRELRGGLSGFYIFLACIALGTAAIAAVNSVSRSITDSIASEGRTLLAADVRFELNNREATPQELAYVQGLGAVITAGLTRCALAEHQVCALGVFSDNTTAIDLYARLGYRIGRAWSSRLLAGA